MGSVPRPPLDDAPVLCLSVFLVVVDNTIVNVALPSLSRDLGASTTALQWIVDAYSLAFAGLLLAGGGIGDRLGRKGVMQTGLVFFGSSRSGAAASHSTGDADRQPGADGRGGGVRLPGLAGHPHECLHRPRRAPEGARHLGRHLGHRRGLRAHRRRRAARALLVRLDLPGQRPDRGGHAHQRRTSSSPAPPRCAHRFDTRACWSPPSGSPAGAGHHRGAAVGLGLAGHPGCFAGAAITAHRLHPPRAADRGTPARRAGVHGSPASPAGRSPSPWPSSASSASSS
jgi:hypothetical protein